MLYAGRRSLLSHLLAALVLMAAPAIRAQVNTGSLRGSVLDPSGAVIPGAVVTAKSEQGVVKAAKTNSQGRYVINGLATGKYEVRVAATGFQPFENSSVEIAGGRQTTLDAHLLVNVERQEVTVTEQVKVDVDPSNNASALVLKGEALDMLSDDPDDLAADLQALAGPSAGPNGGQIYIDGFTGGRLPPKESIREVRINQNPFSSEYDRLGFGRIEIFTKPGTDKFRGLAFFEYGDNALNSRNPFGPSDKPPYQQKQFGGNFSGPISRKSSFFIDVERRNINDDAIINAITVNPDLSLTRLTEGIASPQRRTTVSPRVDYQLSPNHTLVGRYTYTESTQVNNGVGQFSLASRGFNTDMTEHTVQLTETAVLSTRAINETRLQYIREGNNERGDSTTPSVVVPDAFSGGGSPLGFTFVNQQRYELTNSTSLTLGAHSLKFGARLRGVAYDNRDSNNYNGTFQFNSINSYLLTLQLLQQGLAGPAIRAQGGGASQFTLMAGNPVATVNQFDVGAFVQEDWRVRPNFTLSLGLRYEGQNNIGDHADIAPRVGIAWGLGGGKQRQPKTVLRAGFGIFYDRFTEDYTVQAIRLNGVTQQQYIVYQPDFFPMVPSLDQLGAARAPQAIRQIDSSLRAPYVLQSAVGIDRQLPYNITLSVNYTTTRGLHQLRSRNINAPLDGTFVPGVASSGVRPYPDKGNIFLYESSGIFNQHQLITNVNARANRRISLFGFLVVGSAHSDTDGAATFPADQYDLHSEYGRAAFNVPARVFVGGSVTGPLGFRFSPFISANAGRPFNITIGRDLNGDTLFTDRPALATDLTRPSVVHTRYGAFDLNPIPGQTIIPRNYADGPGYFSINLRLSRTWGFGAKSEGRYDPTAGAGDRGPRGFGGPEGGPGGSRGPGGGRGGSGGGGRGRGGPGGLFGDPSTNKRYNLTFSVSARNLLNHVNPGTPIGTLTSPLFGQSNTLGGYGSFGGGGGFGGSQAFNRRLELQLRFSF